MGTGGESYNGTEFDYGDGFIHGNRGRIPVNRKAMDEIAALITGLITGS